MQFEFQIKQFAKRFQQEARIIAKLEHPHSGYEL